IEIKSFRSYKRHEFLLRHGQEVPKPSTADRHYSLPGAFASTPQRTSSRSRSLAAPASATAKVATAPSASIASTASRTRFVPKERI
ncbi:unnamed protein product, partial [Musa acuminata var. zebrina]